jgi:hypothetical protein
VQEFCDAYIPKKVALDGMVLLNGNPVPREKIEVRYKLKIADPVKTLSLSSDPADVTEFNLAERYPGPNTLVMNDGKEHGPRQVGPTELSQAAVAFANARENLESGKSAPKWSAKSVEELKMKCEKHSIAVNKLKALDGKGGALRVWDRLSGLHAGMAACPELFAGQ